MPHGLKPWYHFFLRICPLWNSPDTRKKGFKMDNDTTGSFFLNMTEPLNDPNIYQNHQKKLQFLGTQKTKNMFGISGGTALGHHPLVASTLTIR